MTKRGWAAGAARIDCLRNPSYNRNILAKGWDCDSRRNSRVLVCAPRDGVSSRGA